MMVDAKHPSVRLVSDAPPMLPPRAACVGTLEGAWFLCEVQTRREKALAWQMVENDLGYYLPLVTVVRRIAGIKRQQVLPLFPNYLFGCGDDAQEFCRGSRHVLGVQGIASGAQRRLISDLTNLELALHAKPDLEICDVAQKGQRVEVTAGPFMGMHGMVELVLGSTSDRYCRVVIAIETLGRATQVEVDRDYLSPL